jgi:phage-related protein
MAEDLGVSFTEGLTTAGVSLEGMASATEALNAQYDNWPSMWEGAKRSALLALEPLGDSLLDIGNRIMPIIEGGFVWLQDNVAPIIETIADVIDAFIGNLEEGMSPLDAFIESLWDIAPQWLLDALITLRDDILPALFSAFTLLGDYLSGVWSGITVAFDAFLKLFDGDFEGFGEGLKKAWGILWATITGHLSGIWGWVEPHLSAFLISITEWFGEQEWLEMGQDAIAFVSDGLAELWALIEPKLEEFWTSITEWFEDQEWLEMGQDAIDFVKDGLATLWAKAEPILDEFLKSTEQWFGKQNWEGMGALVITRISAGLKTFESIVTPQIEKWVPEFTEKWDAISASTSAAWNAISAVINAVIAVIGPAIKTFTSSVATELSKFDTLLPALGTLWEALKPIIVVALEIIAATAVITLGVVVGLFNGISAAIGPFIDTFRKMALDVSKIFTGMADLLSATWDLIVAIFTGSKEDVIAALRDMVDAGNLILEGFVSFIWDSLSGAFETILALVSGFVEGVKTFFTTLYNDLVGNSIIPDLVNGIISAFAEPDWLQSGRDIIDGLREGIEEKIQSVRDTIQGLADWLQDIWRRANKSESPSKVWWQFGRDLMLGLANGIAASMNLPLDSLKSLFGDMEAESTAGIVGAFSKAIVAIAGSIAPAIAALEQLNKFTVPQSVLGKFEDLLFQINWVVRGFAAFAWKLGDKSLKEAQDFANTFMSIADVVYSLGGVLTEVKTTEIPTGIAAKFDTLIVEIRSLVSLFAVAASELAEGAAPQIISYTEAASTVFDLVEKAIEAMRFLTDVNVKEILGEGTHLHAQIIFLRNVVLTTMREFSIAAIEMSTDMSACMLKSYSCEMLC